MISQLVLQSCLDAGMNVSLLQEKRRILKDKYIIVIVIFTTCCIYFSLNIFCSGSITSVVMEVLTQQYCRK